MTQDEEGLEHDPEDGDHFSEVSTAILEGTAPHPPVLCEECDLIFKGTKVQEERDFLKHIEKVHSATRKPLDSIGKGKGKATSSTEAQNPSTASSSKDQNKLNEPYESLPGLQPLPDVFSVVAADRKVTIGSKVFAVKELAHAVASCGGSELLTDADSWSNLDFELDFGRELTEEEIRSIRVTLSGHIEPISEDDRTKNRPKLSYAPQIHDRIRQTEVHNTLSSEQEQNSTREQPGDHPSDPWIHAAGFGNSLDYWVREPSLFQGRLPIGRFNFSSEQSLPTESAHPMALVRLYDYPDADPAVPPPLGSETILTNSTHAESSISTGLVDQLEGIPLLVETSEGVLEQPQSVFRRPGYQCLFWFLACDFLSQDEGESETHCLSHFRGEEPPRAVSCPLCEWENFCDDGFAAWALKVAHVAHEHLNHGETFRSSRPDFHLFTHLWRKHLIGDHDFKELRGEFAPFARSIRFTN